MDSHDAMTSRDSAGGAIRAGVRRADVRSLRIRRARRGMTLIEVILAIVILSGAMLGLSNFTRKFQHLTSDAGTQTLASDLATQKLEEIKGHRVYTSIVTTYNGSTENFTTGIYKGYRRTVAAVRTQGTAPVTDYVTVTVSVRSPGDTTATPMKKTTIIAFF